MKKTLLLAGLAAASFTSANAWAITATFGDVNLIWENHLSTGGAVRLQQRDPDLVGIGNGGKAESTNHDDGNLAFGRGTAIAAATKLTSDLTVSYNKFGVFLRGNYLYDPYVMSHDYFNRANYGPGKSAPEAEFDERTRAVRGHLGQNGRLLDAYIYVGSSRVDLQACKLEYSIVSPK